MTTIRRGYADLPHGQVHYAACGDPQAPAVLLLHQSPRSWAEYCHVLPLLGWRGVLERASGPPDPAHFSSVPGGAFPLYHVLADVGEMAGGEVLSGCAADPLSLAGLAIRRGLDLVTGLGQDELHHLGDGRTVIDHQHQLAGHVGVPLTLRHKLQIGILCGLNYGFNRPTD